MATILVIERDSLDLEVISFLLKQDGHRVFAALDPGVAVEILQAHAIDLVTIEPAGRPQDGMRLCQQIRQLNPLTPMIIVSERVDQDQVVRGLTSAADDYLRKPFFPHEFLARVAALLRRASLTRAVAIREDSSISIGGVTLDQQHMAALVNGRRVPLTPRELALLRVFMENPDRVLTRDQLLHLAWGDDFVATAKVVDVYVLRLRRKFRPFMGGEEQIRARRGFGYMYAAPQMPTRSTGAGGPALLADGDDSVIVGATDSHRAVAGAQ